VPALRALGHETSVGEQNSGLHAIVRTRNGWSGRAHPRREGIARGD
jgi:gamma-glutamyltranspeptidase/glutathione hydrolase